MSGPPPPPPPPPVKARGAPSGGGLASLLARSHLSTGDTGATSSASGINPASFAPDVVQAPSPASSNSSSSSRGGGGFNPFMAELSMAVGVPRTFEAQNTPKENPSIVRGGGYKAPPNLPKGGTQGHKMVYYSVDGPQQAKVQSLVEYILYCRDDKKELVEIDPNILEAEIKRVTNNDTMKGKIIRQEKGKFKLQFRCRYVGPHVFNVYVRGALERRPIYKEPGVELLIIPTDTLVKTNMLFSVSGFGMYGGKVGVEASFNINVKDQESGKPMDLEVNKLTIKINQGLKSISGYVSRIDVGKFKGEFKPIGPGEYIITVKYGGQDVVASKAMFNYGVDPSKTCMVDPPSTAKVGEQATFTIQTKASDGTNITVGGERFDVGCSGPSNGISGLVVRDELTGKYTVRFTLQKPGTFKFFIQLKGREILGSPLEVKAQ